MEPEDIRVLIVDDESAVRNSLKKLLEDAGIAVETACDGAVALKRLESGQFDLLLADVQMPGMDGLELQRRLLDLTPDLIVILMTDSPSVEAAVTAMKRGASDYISKPVRPEDLSRVIQEAGRKRMVNIELARLQCRRDEPITEEIVGESDGIREVLDLVKTAASTDSPILIQGESGTGKELVARWIHNRSRRRFFPFIPIACGVLSDSQLERELFGGEDDSHLRWGGKLEMARGSTLFFDEIATLGPRGQENLLRVLETGQSFRPGFDQTSGLDFRIISASSRDLSRLVADGTFQEDLYYRLSAFTFRLPPLRDRRSDIPVLANYFLNRFERSMNKKLEGISREAMRFLMNYSWPGNVRELQGVVERAVAVTHGPRIAVRDLPLLRAERKGGAGGESLDEVVREHILRVLESFGWNMTRTAKTLKIDRVTLYNKLRKYGLERPASKQ